MINIVRQIRLQTSQEAVSELVRKAGNPGHARIFCGAELKPKSGQGGVSSPVSDEESSHCVYALEVSNVFQAALGLSRPSYFLINIDLDRQKVSRISVLSGIGAAESIAKIRIEEAPAEAIAVNAPSFSGDLFVARWNQTDGTPVKLKIYIKPGLDPTDRSRLYGINAACFSKIGGCRNARELLPIKEDL